MTVNAPFLRWVADQAPAVSLPKAFETRADDPGEFNLKSTFERTADFGKRIGELTKDLSTTDGEPPPELKPELDKLQGEFEAFGKSHSDSTDLARQILQEAGSDLFPSQVLAGPNGTFAVVLNRTSEPGGQAPVPEKGFLHEARGLLFVDPTPGADGVIACFQDLKPEPRAEFAQLCGGKTQDIRFADADPSNPFKTEVGPLLKEVVELTALAAQQPGTPEAQAAEARANELQEQLKPYEKFFGDFLAGDIGRGVPMGFEDRGNGIYALQLREVSGSGQVGGPCGYVYLDTRPGLPGFNAFTQLS